MSCIRLVSQLLIMQGVSGHHLTIPTVTSQHSILAVYAIAEMPVYEARKLNFILPWGMSRVDIGSGEYESDSGREI